MGAVVVVAPGGGSDATAASAEGGLMSEDVLGLYDASVRMDPPLAAGVRHERIGGLVRTTGLWNIVQAVDLREEDAPAAVAAQAAFARERGIALEWKAFDHDGPASLRELLRAEGFVADESETFLVYDLARPELTASAPRGIEIRRVVDARGVDDYIAVNRAAFVNQRLEAETYVRSLGDPGIGLFVAYADGTAAAAGRLQTPVGRVFASMWGGGTVPDFRGRGIYRAIVGERAREARRRGHEYVTVDARETSRPILERLGFVALDGVTGWVLRPQP